MIEYECKKNLTTTDSKFIQDLLEKYEWLDYTETIEDENLTNIIQRKNVLIEKQLENYGVVSIRHDNGWVVNFDFEYKF